MGLYQSFRQVFVTNSPALLAEGQTVDNLAVGQFGFLDAKTYKAVVAPTYAKNKALYAVWGTPDVSLGNFGGVPNENEYSKIIKGKLIKGFRAKKAQRGQTPVYTIGWSGDAADTDTLSAKVGESKDVFIKLSGTAIERLYSKQGIIKQLKSIPACVNDCTDTCDDVLFLDQTKDLVAQINSDKDLSKFIKAKSIIECDPVITVVETDVFKFKLSVCDTGDDLALGLVQAQYPNDKVTAIDRNGAITTYEVVRVANSTPTSFSSSTILVPDCPVCPAGGTLVPEAKVFEVKTPSTATPVTIAAAFTGETSITLLNTDTQFAKYLVVFPVATVNATVLSEATTAGFTATFLAVKRNICQVPPTTVAWAANGTLKTQNKVFRITLADTVCGSNRLSELQVAYPDLVVSVVNSAGSCVHTYETTIKSKPYTVGCAISDVVFTNLPLFEGVEWKPLPVDNSSITSCKLGIQIETAFVNRKTNECTFDSFPYENDVVHVQISNYNPDYNASPCEGEWVVKQIRQVKYPQGSGQYIQHLEKESKQYDQRFRHADPVMRELQGYSLQADPNKFYDEYVLEFDTKWKSSGGWAEDYTQSFHLTFFVPEGQGSQLERVVNSYISSAGLEEDIVVI